MSRLTWLGGLCGIVAFALLVAFRGQAAASGPSCAQVDGYLSFCLNALTGGVRRDTTVPLISLPSARADVRVETTVPGSDAAALSVGVDRSVERVEDLFGRAFDPRPRVLLFGTSDSFATAAHELFGYAPETAAHVARTYGGIFDRPTRTIALNWYASDPARMHAAVAHELTHLAIRQATAGREIPAWLDEGIAAVVEQDAGEGAGWAIDEALAGRSVAANGLASFAGLDSVADFHATYARLGRPVYAYAAGAVRAMVQRIGWNGVLATLAAVGNGTRLDAAYLALAGEDLTALERRLPTAPAIATGGMDAAGNVWWSVFAGAPATPVTVSIGGGDGYAVTFTVRTDALGMYRGSFGSTAAPGTYTLRVAGLEATFSTAR